MFDLFKKNAVKEEIGSKSSHWTDAEWERQAREDADDFLVGVVAGTIGDLESGFVFEDGPGRDRSDNDFALDCKLSSSFGTVSYRIITEDHITDTDALKDLRPYPMPSAKERDKIRQYIKENWLRGYLEDDFHPDASIVGDFLAEAMDWSKGHIREGIQKNGYVKDETYIEEFAADDRFYSKEYLVCQTDYDNMWLRIANAWFLSIALYNYLRGIGMIPILTAGGYGQQALDWVTKHTKDFTVYDDEGSVLVSDYRIPLSKKDEVIKKNPEFHMNKQAFKEGTVNKMAE